MKYIFSLLFLTFFSQTFAQNFERTDERIISFHSGLKTIRVLWTENEEKTTKFA
jgi:hypothetical protein